MWTRKMYKEAGIEDEELLQKTEKRIFQSYPIHKKEISGCQSKKVEMESKRNERRKRLISEMREKVVVQGDGNSDSAAVATLR